MTGPPEDLASALYLDHAATTPLAPEALEAMLPFLTTSYGNPSGLHCFARHAAAAFEEAREEAARLLGVELPEQILFTSGGTESNNLALLGLARSPQAPGRRHLLVGAMEHKSILAPGHSLEELGFEVERLFPDSQGRYHPTELEARLRPDTLWVSLALANNEIGTIQDIASLARAAHRQSAHFHCDAVAAGGKMDIHCQDLEVDSLSLSAHKFYGPKGAGLLYLRQPGRLAPLLWGGGQEQSLRSGTPHVAGAVGLAAALRLCSGEQPSLAARLTSLHEALWQRVQQACPQARRLGSPQHALPGLLSVAFPSHHGESLALEMSRQGVAVSSGSACSSQSTGPSHVLQAIGLRPPWIHGSLRFSLGRPTQPPDIPRAVAALEASLQLHGNQHHVF